MSILTALTAIAGVAMTLSYYPQLFKLYRSKNPHGLSLLTYLLFGSGTVIWTIYGIVKSDWMIITSFAPGAVGSWAIFFLIIHYRRRAR